MSTTNAMTAPALAALAGPPHPTRIPSNIVTFARRRETAVGVGAALLAVTVWGSALSITRAGLADGTALGAHDIVVLRFLGPSVALMPVLLRQGLGPLRSAGAGTVLALLVGGGAPFVLLAAAGLRLAPAAEAGALLPSTMPLFVALLSVVLQGERLGRRRIAGFALVSAAVVLVAGPGMFVGAAGPGLRGHVLLLGASAVAAAYTVALRRSGLGPWHAAALVSAGSMLAFGPVYLMALEPGLTAASWREIAVQGLSQSVLSGLVAPVAFATAIARLGATRAAAFGGLTPVVAALAGVLLLDETLGGATALAVGVASLGVALASRHG